VGRELPAGAAVAARARIQAASSVASTLPTQLARLSVGPQRIVLVVYLGSHTAQQVLIVMSALSALMVPAPVAAAAYPRPPRMGPDAR
jgi:hypothetical protein